MATVYITQELRKNIERIINTMRDREVAADIPDNEKAVSINATELMLKMAWGDHRHLMPQLPQAWLKQSHTTDLFVIAGVDEDGKELKYCLTINQLAGYYEIPTADRWSAPRPTCTREWLQANTHLIGAQELLDKLAEREIRTTIEQKWRKTATDILSYLDKCKSLNEALRLWPALKLYVPQEYIERVETKVERRKREADILESVDIGELTAAAIAAKLAGGV